MNTKTHFKQFEKLLTFALITFTLFPLFYYYEIEADINLTTFKYAAYIILLSLIPQMIFHFWYWFLSKIFKSLLTLKKTSSHM